MPDLPSVLLATFDLMPEGEPGGEALVQALAGHGVEAAWARWSDPTVDWSSADLVAVRATWDYHRRLRPFLAWAHELDRHTRLLNGAEVFAWNADKAYLLELAGIGVPVVPTALVDDDTLVAGMDDAFARWGTVVIKPRTGAGGNGVVVAAAGDLAQLEGLLAGPWTIQPLVESVRTLGESAVMVFDGRAVAQVDKRPGGGEIRVHEHHGGRSARVELDPARARVAEQAVHDAAALRGADLAYARVDLMQWDGAWVVSELELIEPGLYLDVQPEVAEPFAAMVAARLPAGT